MEKKSSRLTYLIMVLVTVCLSAGIYWIIESSHKRFAGEVERTLMVELSKIENLITYPQFGITIAEANLTNSTLNREEIVEKDKNWIKARGNDSAVNQLMTNASAKILLDFQKKHPQFREIFITDMYGLNVAVTNKTTDYYQADEDWWIIAYNGGKGIPAYAGEIEYDESAKTWAYPLYSPIRNARGNVIGVVKAVLDVKGVR